MVFKSKDNKWVGTIKSRKSTSDRGIKLDSGAAITALSLTTAAELIGWRKMDLANYLRDRETVKFEGIGGYADLVPCKLHNVIICDTVVRDFYCMTSAEGKMPRNLLGADFIGACQGKIYYDKDVVLYDLDNAVYQRRFISQCQGAHAMEIWSIDSFETMDLVTKVISGAVYAPSCEAWRGQNNYDTNTYEKELRHIVDMCKISDVDALEEIIRSL